MMECDEGLTTIYNRFHNPHERSPDILKLRELHAAMDRAVLEAYGWHDLAQNARCEFLLDYEEDEGIGDSGSGTGEGIQSPAPKPQSPAPNSQSRRRKPWRLRWPDDFRDEVLARLLELNEQRHAEELLAGSSQLLEKKGKPAKTKRGGKRGTKPADDEQQKLEF